MDQLVTSESLSEVSKVDSTIAELESLKEENVQTNRKVNAQQVEIETLKRDAVQTTSYMNSKMVEIEKLKEEIELLKEETTQAMHMVRMVNTKLLELNSREEMILP